MNKPLNAPDRSHKHRELKPSGLDLASAFTEQVASECHSHRVKARGGQSEEDKASENGQQRPLVRIYPLIPPALPEYLKRRRRRKRRGGRHDE